MARAALCIIDESADADNNNCGYPTWGAGQTSEYGVPARPV